MNITAYTAVSSTPKGGVTYTAMPVMNAAQRAAAIASADALIATGLTGAALGPYRPRSPFMNFLVATGIGHFMTGMLGRPFRSRRSFVVTGGLLCVTYVWLQAAGIIDAIGMFATGVYGWAMLTWDAYWETYEVVQALTTTAGEFAQHYQIGVREVGLLVIGAVLLMIGWSQPWGRTIRATSREPRVRQ